MDPAATAPRPHAVTQVASTGSNPGTETLSYDDVGNTDGRATSVFDSQNITWDREGRQKSVTDGASGDETSYIYDADGNRLIKQDESTDSTTLYVGASEYILKDDELSIIRSYTVGDAPVATRTATGVTVMIGDRNNSGQLAVDSATLAVQKRRFGPFGNELQSPAGPWPSDRGYLNKTTDASTGTTHLGAREYDTTLGRFLSVDPVMDPMDPQQMNGYAYASNSPVTLSDPSGLYIPCEGQRCAQKGGGGVYLPKSAAWNKQANANLAGYVMKTLKSSLRKILPRQPKKEKLGAVAKFRKDFGAGIRRAAGGLVDTVGQVGANKAGYSDFEFDYGTRGADWINNLDGSDPHSIGGIIGQLTFNMIPLGPPAAAAAAGLPRALRGVSLLARTGKAAKSTPEVSQILLRSPGQLQSKFKHAGDFGVSGNYSKANATEFSRAINRHINAAGTRAIQGKYHGDAVTHYLDASTGLNVISRGGEFVSGWRLSSGQLSNVLKHGGLGGG